jgi:hypothetical protein
MPGGETSAVAGIDKAVGVLLVRGGVGESLWRQIQIFHAGWFWKGCCGGPGVRGGAVSHWVSSFNCWGQAGRPAGQAGRSVVLCRRPDGREESCRRGQDAGAAAACAADGNGEGFLLRIQRGDGVGKEMPVSIAGCAPGATAPGLVGIPRQVSV